MKRTALFALTAAIAATTFSPAFALGEETTEKVDFDKLRQENLDKMDFDKLRRENLDKVDFDKLREANRDKANHN